MDEPAEPLWLHAHARLTITELAQCAGLAPEVIGELVEMGALAPVEAGATHFSASCVAAVRTAARLRADLELDTVSLALAVAFLQRIEALEARVRDLDAQVGRRHD